MSRPIEVKALPDYKIKLKFEDGVEGEIDLSDLVGKPAFKIWDDYKEFEKVHLGDGGDVRWNDDIDLCPDALYMEITGIDADDYFRRESASA